MKSDLILIEHYRVLTGDYGSDPEDGHGMFIIPTGGGIYARCICSYELGWEHVSISLLKKRRNQFSSLTRCPHWAEMCTIKDHFWHPQEPVYQIHPPRSEYINNVNNCLHLWRPTSGPMPLPDKLLVGLPELNL